MKISLLLMTVSAFAVPTLQAQVTALTDSYWRGDANGGWRTNDNWTTAGFPSTLNHHAWVDGSESGGTPVLMSGTASLNLGGLTVGTGYTVRRTDSATGNLTLNFNHRETDVARGVVVFNNHGTLASGGASGSLTITLRSNVSSGLVTDSYVNSGVIEASAGTAVIFTQQTGGGGVSLDNTGGTIRTVGNGEVYFPSYIHSRFLVIGGTVANASGTVHLAQERGQLEMEGVTVTNGGTIRMQRTRDGGANYRWVLRDGSSVTNSGLIEVIEDMSINKDHRLSKLELTGTSLNNTGTLRMTARGTQALEGTNWWSDPETKLNPKTAVTGLSLFNTSTINNDGLIEIRAESDLTLHVKNRLELSLNSAENATLTLSGTGVLHFDDQTNLSTMQVEMLGGVRTDSGVTYSSHLVNSAGHTIRGAAAISGFHTIMNAGLFHADGAKEMSVGMRTVDSVEGVFTNTGEIRVAQGSDLRFGSGRVSSTGVIRVDGRLSAANGVSLMGGELRGSGVLAGDVQINHAMLLRPEGDALSIDGNLVFAESGDAHTISLLYEDTRATLSISGNFVVGDNVAFDFTFGGTGGFQENMVYSLIDVAGTHNLNPSDFSISLASLSAGFRLDESFGVGGWNLNGGTLQVRFSEVAAIPEGETAMLMAVGLGFLFVIQRRRSLFRFV